MSATTETLLSTIPCNRSDERLLVVLLQSASLGSRLELRQQSWGEGVGWFTQNRVELETDQVADLRQALGTRGPRQIRSRLPAPQKLLRIHAESA